MKVLLTALTVSIAISLFGQTSLDAFEHVSVFGNIHLKLVKGDKNEYTATGHTEELKVRVVEGKLKISHKSSRRFPSVLAHNCLTKNSGVKMRENMGGNRRESMRESFMKIMKFAENV